MHSLARRAPSGASVLLAAVAQLRHGRLADGDQGGLGGVGGLLVLVVERLDEFGDLLGFRGRRRAFLEELDEGVVGGAELDVLQDVLVTGAALGDGGRVVFVGVGGRGRGGGRFNPRPLDCEGLLFEDDRFGHRRGRRGQRQSQGEGCHEHDWSSPVRARVT